MKKKNIYGIIVVALVCIGIILGGKDIVDKSNSNNYQNTNVDESNVSLEGDILEVHFIDQTTPNMIQGISGIYERNPLISKGILPFLNFKWFRKGSFFMPGFKESKKLATIIQ